MSKESFSPQFGSPFQVVVDHCEEAGIKFRAEPDVKGVFFSMRGEMAIYDVALLITHDDQVFQIYITIPIATTEERLRPVVAEFVTRANHRIVVGQFDYDFDEGLLRSCLQSSRHSVVARNHRVIRLLWFMGKIS